MSGSLNKANITNFGHFDDLCYFTDSEKVREYFERIENVKLESYEINMRIDSFLRNFILSRGIDIEISEE